MVGSQTVEREGAFYLWEDGQIDRALQISAMVQAFLWG